MYSKSHNHIDIAADNNHKVMIVFLFLHKNICCGTHLHENMLWYSLAVPSQCPFNEYPKHLFSRRNKKNITLQPLYNTVRYNMVLDTKRFKDGSQKCIGYIEK